MEYLTDFEKMMIGLIADGNVKQYTDEESSAIFQSINRGVGERFGYQQKQERAHANRSARECIIT